MSFWTRHQIFEKNSIVLIAGILVVIAIGGLVEITPLFYLKSTIEVVDGVRPYTPLELTGRNIYVREGCYLCHSQMIRPLRDEVERYGHYSLAAESMYDHPFQWGSKRTGPDLARVGAKYSDEWHVTHLVNPRAIVPQSVMPGYPFLCRDRSRSSRAMADHLRTSRCVGVPYSDDQIANAVADLKAQADPDNAGADAFAKRYPKAVARNFDGKAGSADRNGCAGRVPADARARWSTSSFTTKKQIFAEKAHTMKAILTVQNITSDFVTTLLDADLRRNISRHRGLRALAPQQGGLRRGVENPVAGGMTRSWLSTAKSTTSPVQSTTGHEWDGIKELNTPLPRWWVITFYSPSSGRSGTGSCIRPGRCCDEPHHRACSDTRPAPTSRSNSPIWKRSAATRWWRSAPRRWRKSRRIRHCWRWPAPAARRCSATIARHATAAAAPAPRATPI